MYKIYNIVIRVLTDYVDFVREVNTPVLVAHIARVVAGISYDQVLQHNAPLRVLGCPHNALDGRLTVFVPRYVRSRIACAQHVMETLTVCIDLSSLPALYARPYDAQNIMATPYCNVNKHLPSAAHFNLNIFPAGLATTRCMLSIFVNLGAVESSAAS